MRAMAIVLLLGVSVGAWGASNPPTPTPAESAGNPQEKAAQADTDSKNKEVAAKALSLLFDNLSALKSEYNAHVSREHEKEKTQYEAMVGYGTIALAGFTAFLMWFTYRLWSATGRLVSETAESAQKELRAYLGLEDIFFVAIDTVRPRPHWQYTNSMRIRIKNFGQTPAHNVQVNINRVRNQEMIDELIQPTILQPSQRFGRGLREDGRFGANNHHFIVTGRIIYQDIYNRWWRTLFGFAYETNGVFTPIDGAMNRESGPYKTLDDAINDG